MNCFCGKDALLPLGDKVWCRGCFIEQVERRIKLVLRDNKFDRGDKVLVVGNVAAFAVKKIVNMPVELTFSDTMREGYDAVVIQWTLDDECVAFFEQTSFQAIKLFLHLRDSEVAAYAQLLGLSFTPREKNPLWTEFLAHAAPDMMYNLLKNVEEMRKITSKM